MMFQCFVVNDVTFVSSCVFRIFYRGARIKEIENFSFFKTSKIHISGTVYPGVLSETFPKN